MVDWKGKGKGKAPQPRGNSNRHCTGMDLTIMSLKIAASQQHIVLLYQRSLKEKKSSEELRFEAHFNLTKERPEVESSHQAPIEQDNNLVLLP
jgi:hypothetical protein